MGAAIRRELALAVTGKDVSAGKTLRGVGREMGKLEHIAGKAGSNISRNIQRGVVLGAGAAVGAIGYAVNAAMDYESSSASVRKTVDGNVDAILNANRALATHTGLEINTLNEISATAGALDVAKGDIASFTKTVAILAVTTDDVTTDLGATSLGHLKTTLGLAGKDFEHFGNDLVYLGNHGASTEGQILSMAENIAGAANIMGASTPQVLGWAAAVANTGEEAEAGGSSIQRFWLESFKSVQAGGKDLKLMAKISGTTAAAFKKSFGKDATGTLAKFLVGLGKLSKAEQVATLNALGFKDIRITRALLKILGNTDNLTSSLKGTEKGWKDNNAATEEAAKRFATTASKVAILKANVNDAAITIGQELLPVIADLSTDAVGWITAHRADIHDFAETLSGGIKDAVTWAKKLDWQAIGNALKAGADGAKFLVDAFLSAPPWLQQFLAVGFVANKFSGGALGDIAGELGKGLIKGVLGMNAGVVNINAGVVNGGAGVGAAGAAGALGKGRLASVASTIGKVFLVGAAIGVFAELKGILDDQSQANRDQGTANVTNAANFTNANDALKIQQSLTGINQTVDNIKQNDLIGNIALYNNIDGVRDSIDATKAELNRGLVAAVTAESATTTAVEGVKGAMGFDADRQITAAEKIRSAVSAQDLSVTVHNTIPISVSVPARGITSATTHQTLVAGGTRQIPT